MSVTLQRLQKVRLRVDGVAELAERLGPLWAAFGAWWTGDEPPPKAAPTARAAPEGLVVPGKCPPIARAAAPEIATEAEDPHWPSRRIKLVQRIWGDGFTEVGGVESAKNLALPLGLTSAKSALDLTARLGGTGRALFEFFGVYVTGLEANPALAEAGMAISVQKGMATKAPVDPYDPARLKLKKRFDCILAREGFYNGSHRIPSLKTAAKALKPGGQMLLVDFVRPEGPTASAALDRWAASMPGGANPWTAAQFSTALEKLKLTVRINEDITDQYRHTALSGWSNFLDGLTIRDLSRPEVFALVDEAEQWLHRMAALDAGALSVYRFRADL